MTPKLLVVLGLAACAGDPSSSVDTTDPAEFCRAAATTGCSTMYACLTDAERTQRHLPATEPECERALKATCETALDTCPSMTHVYAPTTAQTCLDQMAIATCSDAGQAWLDAKACSDVCERTGGSFGVSWSFDPAYSCSDLMIATVRVVSSGAAVYADDFSCNALAGVTDVLPIGDYSVHFELYGTNGALMWTGPSALHTIDGDAIQVSVVVPVGPS